MKFQLASTLHNHTTLSDGRHTPEQMVLAALDAGMTDFGISDHSCTPHDLRYCIADTQAYLAQLRALQARYAGQIRLHVGIEQDFFGPVPDRRQFDYIIGSVHYYPSRQGYYDVDGSAQDTARALNELFDGDAMAMTRAYYQQVVRNVQTYRPDVIGHFDLLVKSNEKGHFFNEEDPRWQSIALDALDACIQTGGVFEINTGAMTRQTRTIPYPAPFLLRRMGEKGARVMLSADCHDAGSLLFALPQAALLMRSCGFTTHWVYLDGLFVEQPLPV